MAKFEKKLQELGFSYEQLSPKLKKRIDDYKEDEGILKEVKSKLGSVSDEQREGLETDISELTQTLSIEDEDLTKEVEKYYKNKDRYAEMGKKLAEGRKNAKNGKKEEVVAKPQPQPQQTPQAQTQPQPQPQPQTQAQPQPQAQPQTQDKKPEKKGNALGWVVGGLIAVVSLGMVIKFAKK